MLGAFAPEYARHAIIREGLEAHGVDVTLIPAPPHAPMRERIEHLRKHFAEAAQHDVVLIPAFNQLLGPLAWWLAKRYKTCLLMDYMIGQLDMLLDRQATISRPKQLLYSTIERFNLRFVPSITDTALHRDYFEQLTGIRPKRMAVLPVGVREIPMLPTPNLQKPLVQYAGTFIPFHGVDVILRAAERLPNIAFELIGVGQCMPDAQQMKRDLQLTNVNLVEAYVPLDELRQWQARSTIMLGVFGAADKTDYVIPNKVFEALALGRPLITAESRAIASVFTTGEHLITAPPDDPEALAMAIQSLVADPAQQQHLREAGRVAVETTFFPEMIGARLLTLLHELCVK